MMKRNVKINTRQKSLSPMNISTIKNSTAFTNMSMNTYMNTENALSTLINISTNTSTNKDVLTFLYIVRFQRLKSLKNKLKS